MLRAKAGGAAAIEIRPRQFFQQAFFITLLNPKAIVFYMAFFQQFVHPTQHRGLLTFGVMALTVARSEFMACPSGWVQARRRRVPARA
jgi:threonine/homoserine/homoserine lactone efflux protein